jgi:hypothetical protein
MPTPKLDDDKLIEALNLLEQYGSSHLAVKSGATDIPRNTLESRIHTAKIRGLKPTFKKDAPRIYTRQRLGRMHIWLPDVQSKPGVRNDHLEWIGNYIAEKQPDVLGCIGDFWDMPSLSTYDKGKAKFEGQRYVKDVDAGRAAMEKLLKPIDDYNRTAKEKYNPEKPFLLGNHCHRISRFVENNAEFKDKFSIKDLGIEDYGWTVHDFLKVVTIDNIEFSHYFTSGVMGRPVSSAAAMLKARMKSCVMGHVQTFDMAVHQKTQNIAMMIGTCYLHDEDYLGPQGNDVRRQIVVFHEVEDGKFDPMLVSLKFLEKAYS